MGLVGAGLGAAACPSVDGPTGEGRTGVWGDPRPGGAEALIPAGARPDGILELFLIGGIAPWDTLYVVPDHGDPAKGGPYAGTQWWTFQETGDNIPGWLSLCGGSNRPLLESSWATDPSGRQVYLGPFLYPLRERPDIVRRLRLWVVVHGQSAHETAIPLALCGQLQSSARMASTGAHIERFMQARGDGTRENPYSAVIYPRLGDLSALNTEVASAVGMHSGTARPLSLRLSPNGLSAAGLERVAVASRRDRLDQAVMGYLDRYEAAFFRSGASDRVRAQALDDFRNARRALGRTDSFLSLVGSDAFEGAFGEECVDSSPADYTEMGLRIAVNMLTHPTEPVRYVNCIDGGLLPATGGAAYDTHLRHVSQCGRNLSHTMKSLVSRINEPGEGDPDKLDLDRHTVLLTTEFGRTPYAVGDGTNHWTEGYVVAAFGGLFEEDHSGVVGSIGEDGFAIDYITPTDFRASLLLAMGIWPFNDESFAVADVSADSLSELDAAVYLREQVLGYRL
ncbi:MAG: DUF1501 domain-containing protein [Myxococcota bacterium]|nr:DUF1501 domain-containing protein [Myxococcota bacterium]